MDNIILQLRTGPASSIGLSESGLTRFRKELIKVGSYVKDSTKQSFTVARETLNHWVRTFDLWLANGNKVSVPMSHNQAGDVEANQGWVTGLAIEGDSLYGIMELKNPALALTSDVSIYVKKEVVDGKGIKYQVPITHVALCVDPIIPGLESFEKLELSLGDTNMEFLKNISKKLGLSSDTPSEADVIAALDAKLTPAIEPEPNSAVAKLLSDNRELKLSGLVKAGLITPALKDVITAKYVEPKAVTLELSQAGDYGAFDFLYDVLANNKPVSLAEKTGVQSLELSNAGLAKPNAVQADVKKRREAAGLKD